MVDKEWVRVHLVKGTHAALRRVGQAPEHRAARRLRQTRIGTNGERGPKVLFLTPRDWAAHVQWEAMIGHALEARGAEVSFLSCGGRLEICDRANTWESPPMPCGSCRRYVRTSIDAHGFPISDLALDDDPDEEWPDLDSLSLDELRRVECDGYPLGELVAIPVRWFLMRSTLDDDPLGPLTTRRFLRSARRILHALERRLADANPDTVILLNGLFLFEAIANAICERRGIDVVSYERGFIKETLVFRRGAPACFNEIDEAWERYASTPLSPAEGARLDAYLEDRQHGRRTIDQYWNDVRFEDFHPTGTDRRLVSLFTNLTWDSAVIGQEIAFPTIQEWVGATIRAFAARPQHDLVIRLHPAEVKLAGKETREPLGEYIDQTFGALPPNVRVIAPEDPTSSYPLMDASDIGLVFTSTTGLELAIRGVPVVVAGRTHYRGKGFTVDVSSPEEFETALDSVLAASESFMPDPELVRRYASLFFFRVPIIAPGVEEHVLGLARLTASSLEDLDPGNDPETDRMCDFVLGASDKAIPEAAPPLGELSTYRALQASKPIDRRGLPKSRPCEGRE